MEAKNSIVSRKTRKRTSHETFKQNEVTTLDDLNQDVLERVLSYLPTTSFYTLTSVCKRWKSATQSTTFKLACSQVPHRDPWFLMVNSQPDPITDPPIIFDSSNKTWKKLNNNPLHPVCLHQNPNPNAGDFVPVAAAGGLICHHSHDGEFIVTNPVTSTRRHVPPPRATRHLSILAIAMKSESDSFNLVLLTGDFPNLAFRKYDSVSCRWGDEVYLTRKMINGPITSDDQTDGEDCGTQPYFFLTKCGNVVSADIQWSVSKQYSSVYTVESGEEMLYFLSLSGTVVACNLTRGVFFEYPRLMPAFSDYSIDLIECGGEMHVVLLSEFLESATVRIWKWDVEGGGYWRQVAGMPISMSHDLYGKKVDVNCSGGREKVLVCLSSSEAGICRYVMCDLDANEWVELPKSCGFDKEFVCGFSFEPRIEALNM